MTKTFKNKNFTKRNYDCTNLVFCKAETAPNANWVETSEPIPANMMQLFIERQNGKEVAFHGFL